MPKFSKKLSIVVSLILVLIVAPVIWLRSPKETKAWDNGYTFRSTLTVDNTKVAGTANLTSFPMLFTGTFDGTGGEPDLRTTANGGNVTDAQGDDIIFTSDAAGSTVLDFERETYTATTGAVNFWVEVPTLDFDDDTLIYMFYGNSSVTTSQEDITGTWDANYAGVWHLNEGDSTAAGFYEDSTSNNNDITLTDSDGDVTTVAGKVSDALNFIKEKGDYLSPGDPASLDITGALTLEA